MDQRQIFGRMFQIPVDGQDDDEGQSYPAMEAQAMELQARWKEYQKPVDLKPGDLCMNRPGLGCRRKAPREGQLMMVWRMLDFASDIDRQHLDIFMQAKTEASDRPDCVVATIGADGGGIAFGVEELRHLQKWHPDPAIQRSLDARDAPSDAQSD